MSDTFKCAACGGVFDKGWTEDEAVAEREKLWPGFTEDECDVICDACFKQFMAEGGDDLAGIPKP